MGEDSTVGRCMNAGLRQGTGVGGRCVKTKRLAQDRVTEDGSVDE